MPNQTLEFKRAHPFPLALTIILHPSKNVHRQVHRD